MPPVFEAFFEKDELILTIRILIGDDTKVELYPTYYEKPRILKPKEIELVGSVSYVDIYEFEGKSCKIVFYDCDITFLYKRKIPTPPKVKKVERIEVFRDPMTNEEVINIYPKEAHLLKVSNYFKIEVGTPTIPSTPCYTADEFCDTILEIIKTVKGKKEEKKIEWEEYSTEDLINMYIRYKTEKPEWAKEIKEVLIKRGIKFCPIHDLPLEERVIAGILLFKCPKGELWRLKGNKLVQVSPREIETLIKLLGQPPQKEVSKIEVRYFTPADLKVIKAHHQASRYAQDFLKAILQLAVILNIRVVDYRDLLNVDWIKTMLRREAVKLYYENRDLYEKLKREFYSKLPPDLASFIFPY